MEPGGGQGIADQALGGVSSVGEAGATAAGYVPKVVPPCLSAAADAPPAQHGSSASAFQRGAVSRHDEDRHMIREDIRQKFPELFGTKKVNGQQVDVDETIE